MGMAPHSLPAVATGVTTCLATELATCVHPLITTLTHPPTPPTTTIACNSQGGQIEVDPKVN